MNFLNASFDNLTEDLLLKQWNEDMSHRDRVRRSARTRNCVSVSMLLNGYDRFYSNEDVRFLLGADYPAKNLFPGYKRMNDNEANIFSLVKAEFERFGVPEVDAARAERVFNTRLKPFDKKTVKVGNGRRKKQITAEKDVVNSVTENRLLAVANLANEAMTDWARHAVDFSGKHFNKAWADKKSKGFKYTRKRAEATFPIALAGYPVAKANEVFFPATESPTHPVAECPSCHVKHSVTDIKYRRFVESGDFIGTCPSCGDERKYHLSDTVDSKYRRNFNYVFKRGFCDAIAESLPIYAPFDLVYAGRSEGIDEDGLVHHRFGHVDSSKDVIVKTLPNTKVSFEFGQGIEEGTLLCRVLPANQNLKRWAKQRLDRQWATIHTVVPRRELIPVWQRQWFDFQAVHIEDEPDYVFWPMSLVTQATRTMPADKLYWDIEPCSDFLADDSDVNAVILPPIRADGRSDLQFEAKNIAFSAEIADRRYRHSPVQRRAQANQNLTQVA